MLAYLETHPRAGGFKDDEELSRVFKTHLDREMFSYGKDRGIVYLDKVYLGSK